MNKKYTPLENIMNPIEYKRFGEALEYYKEEYTRIINYLGIIHQEMMHQFTDYLFPLLSFAGLFLKEFDLNECVDFSRALYQTKVNNQFPKLDTLTFAPTKEISQKNPIK